MALTIKGIEALLREVREKPQRFADGEVDGLYLYLGRNGAGRITESASWVLRVVVQGSRRDIGLGPLSDVKLAAARETGRELRQKIAAGIDPVAERKAAQRKIPTFAEAVEAFLADNENGWRNEKHRAQWRMTLGDTYCKTIRSKPVNEIAFDDVVRILKPIWTKVPETASRLRGRIERVLDAAKVQGFRQGENPAAWKGNLAHVLPKPEKLTRGHHKAMPFADMPSFMARLTRGSSRELALEFTVLTALRSQEALGVCWDEIDLEKRTLTVPAGPTGRMKVKRAGKVAHVVPLSDRAVAVLEAAKANFPESTLVFPGGKRGKPLSGMAMPMLLRDMKVDEVATVHGFRSSFRDWAAETTAFPNEVVEMALAHEIGSKVEAAYRRGDLLEKRRELMQAWANYVSGTAANVVAFKRSA